MAVVSVFLLSIFHYGWKHRPFEALAAGVSSGHPLASAACTDGIRAIVIDNTPNNASAATSAILFQVDNYCYHSYTLVPSLSFLLSHRLYLSMRDTGNLL